MSKDFSEDTVNFSEVVSDQIHFVSSTREIIVDTVIRYGVLDINANYVESSKEHIANAYSKKYTSQKAFGEFLCEMFCKNGYSPVNIGIDDWTPYKPFKLLYNQAGLQFQFRDRNLIIHIECIGWSEVALRIGRMIRHDEFFSDVPLSELRTKRRKDYER